jgi:hypothetical protein
MAERRTLVEGLREISPEADPKLAEEFILHGVPKSAAFTKLRKAAAQPAVEPVEPEGKGQQANHMGRAPLTIRFRADFAKALKHASLERQMKGISPYKLQDILEEVVEPWLRNNGYLN